MLTYITALTHLGDLNKGLALKSFSNKSTGKPNHYQYTVSTSKNLKKRNHAKDWSCGPDLVRLFFSLVDREEWNPAQDDLGPLCS